MTEAPCHPPGAKQIEAAFTLFLRLRAEMPDAPPLSLALQAVDTIFCTRLALSSESVACRLAPSREAELAAELLRRAGLAPEEPGSEEPPDRVERTSEQSFPAIDPTGWIWGGAEPAGGDRR